MSKRTQQIQTYNDDPQDELISYVEKLGWRLEIWKPGLWLDSYDWCIRSASIKNEVSDQDALCGGLGYASVDAAKEAAIAAFKEKMRSGHLKPRNVPQRDEPT